MKPVIAQGNTAATAIFSFPVSKCVDTWVAVEHSPRESEVEGSIPAGRWAFSFSLLDVKS